MRASGTLHRTLLHGILRAPMAFFMTTPTGRLLSRFSNDVDTLDYKLPMNTKLSLIQIFRVGDDDGVVVVCLDDQFVVVLVFVVYFLR